MKNPDACSPGIADVSHMIQGASDFAMAATSAFAVVYFYFGHGGSPNPDLMQ